MMRATLAALLLLTVTMSGCLGGEERTEWAYDLTGLDALYSEGKRGTGITVAVLDTGINVAHPSLDHLRDGDTSNGELIAFRDYINNRNGVAKAYDDHGHGSHVIGIMSARGSDFTDKLVNGGVDLLGASPSIQLVVAKVCPKEGSCDAGSIDDAIRWAVDQGADIISLSLGGIEIPFLQGTILAPEQQRMQEAVRSAINGAIDKGIVVVAAAGNEQNDEENPATDVSFPANIPGVIAVGAINSKQQVAAFSNHGSASENQCTSGGLFPSGRCDPNKKPELVAPGVGILSAWSGDAYVRADGTSQATPFVASAIALILEGRTPLNDRGDVDDLKDALRRTAAPIGGAGHSNASGYGIVQADRAANAFS